MSGGTSVVDACGTSSGGASVATSADTGCLLFCGNGWCPHMARNSTETERCERRLDVPADVFRERAPWRERATWLVQRQVGWRARNAAQLHLVGTRVGVAAQQRFGIRVVGPVEKVARRHVFDNAAGVHHQDPVGCLEHNAQV